MQTALQSGLLGGHTDRTRVLSTPEPLATAQRHHHGSRRINVVCTLNTASHHIAALCNLPRSANPAFISQPCSDPPITDGHQTLCKRHPNVVFVLDRSRSGATFRAIDNNKV